MNPKCGGIGKKEGKFRTKEFCHKCCPLCNTVFTKNPYPFSLHSRMHCVNSLTGQPVMESCPHLASKPLLEKFNFCQKFNFCKVCLLKEVSENHKEDDCKIVCDFYKCLEPNCDIRAILCVKHKEKNNLTLIKMKKIFLKCKIPFEV